ncbi:hypothetical protein KAU11_01585 [Candidatus Babeliales bacterium]|nr:hypothetical protein [Candidatus Babeliales bacterium]
MKRFTALFILIISSCSLRARYDFKQLALEQICGLLSVAAHETGHALFAKNATGKFPEIVLGFPDNQIKKWAAIKIDRNRRSKSILSFNSAGIIGGYTIGNPNEQVLFQTKASKIQKIATYAAGPVFGASADFIMATIIEMYKNRKNKWMSKKEIFKKAFDRAAPSMLSHLTNLIIPLEETDGANIITELGSTWYNDVRPILIAMGFVATFFLRGKISKESNDRFSKYRIKPAAALFAGTELSKIGYEFANNGTQSGMDAISDTGNLIYKNPLAMAGLATHFIPEFSS